MKAAKKINQSKKIINSSSKCKNHILNAHESANSFRNHFDKNQHVAIKTADFDSVNIILIRSLDGFWCCFRCAISLAWIVSSSHQIYFRSFAAVVSRYHEARAVFLDNWPLAFDEAYGLHICLSFFVNLVIFSVWCLAFQFPLPYSALSCLLI